MNWIFIKESILPLVPLLTPIIALSAIYFSFKQYRFQKYLGYVERQLDNFYGPMLGYINYLDANRELKVILSEKENEVLNDKEIYEFVDNKEKTQYIYKSIKYSNVEFHEKIFPQYRKMMNLFSEHSSCVLPETMKHYYTLYKFVEVWERSIAEVINSVVIVRLDHSEEHLKEFYTHIKTTVQELQYEVSNKRK